MIRRLLIIASCIVVCGAPLADSLCVARCVNGEASGTPHSCAPERVDAAAISTALHQCSNGDGVATAAVEVRHAIGALVLPPLVLLNPLLPIVSVVGDARPGASQFSPHPNTPLRV